MVRWEEWKDSVSLVGDFESEVIGNKAKWKFMGFGSDVIKALLKELSPPTFYWKD